MNVPTDGKDRQDGKRTGNGRDVAASRPFPFVQKRAEAGFSLSYRIVKNIKEKISNNAGNAFHLLVISV